MSTPPPTTPARASRGAAAITRSFTVPARPTTSNEPETLFFHPNAKILKFDPGLKSRPDAANKSASSLGVQQGNGDLPWTTPNEKTVAVGPLEICSSPASGLFLRSGSLRQVLMRRSQCWCVDGVSRFAMRVPAGNNYFRIELPGVTAEDLEKVEELKAVLAKRFSYERTPCPFARTFTVDLPEELPVKRRRRRTHGPAKRWKLQKALSWKPEDWKPEDDEEMLALEDDKGEEEDESGSATASDEYEDSALETPEAVDNGQDQRVTTPSRPTVSDRVRDFSAKRSATMPMPPPTQSVTSPRLPAGIASGSTVKENVQLPSRSPQQETSGMRMYQAIPTDMPPSPPDSSAGHEPVNSVARSGNYDAVQVRKQLVDANDLLPAFRPQAEQSDGDMDFDEINPYIDRLTKLDQQPLQLSNEASDGLQAATTASTEPSDSVDAGPHTSTALGFMDEEESQSSIVAEQLPMSLKSSIPDADPFVHKSSEGSGTATTTGADLSDPFVQIRARIQARRSIGGANSPHLASQLSSSTSSSTSLAPARPPLSHHNSQHQQALTAAIVNKACAVFFGPPAHLVKILLRIARALYFQPPASETDCVPGNSKSESNDVEDSGHDVEVEEDDFGVPLQSPVRLARYRR